MDIASAPLLSIIMFLPLVGAIIIAFLNPEAKGNARWIAFWTTLVTFIVSLIIWFNFDRTAGGFQFVEQRRRLPVHPHQFPARLPRPRTRDQVVLFLAHHDAMSSRAES